MSHDSTHLARKQKTGSPARKAVLLVLADMADQDHSCFPSQAYIGRITEQSERSVREHIRVLAEMGLVRVESRGKPGGGRTSNRYVLAVEQTGEIPGRTGHPPPERTGELLPGNPQKNHQIEPGRETTRGEALLAEGFDRFWAVYPRREGKGDARKAWPAAVKAAGGVTPIIAGAERYATDPNREARYTATPGPWLRGERWGDDPLPARGGQRPRQPAGPPAEDERRARPSGRIEL